MNSNQLPDFLPESHSRLLRRALEELKVDARLVGIAAGGSYLARSMDEFSDLDLIIAVEPSASASVMKARREIASTLGPLLAAFTGEHVGEPRLLICLYGPPVLHVDLKFMSLADVAARVEDPEILWERDGRFSAALRGAVALYPKPDLQWIEDRFWTWVHYAAAKVGRGELFEAIDSISFLRAQALGPLILMSGGARPTGVRKIEVLADARTADLAATVAAYEARSCARALHAAVALYRELRDELSDASLVRHPDAEAAARDYLRAVAQRIGSS